MANLRREWCTKLPSVSNLPTDWVAALDYIVWWLKFKLSTPYVLFRTELCQFSGLKIYPGHGKRYARIDGKVFNLLSAKCASLLVKKKNPRKIAWTVLYRRKHKKGTMVSNLILTVWLMSPSQGERKLLGLHSRRVEAFLLDFRTKVGNLSPFLSRGSKQNFADVNGPLKFSFARLFSFHSIIAMLTLAFLSDYLYYLV